MSSDDGATPPRGFFLSAFFLSVFPYNSQTLERVSCFELRLGWELREGLVCFLLLCSSLTFIIPDSPANSKKDTQKKEIVSAI